MSQNYAAEYASELNTLERIAKARADAFDKCAEIVDALSHPDVDDGIDAVLDALTKAATAIRAAKDKP